jgi:hypothetical protein
MENMYVNCKGTTIPHTKTHGDRHVNIWLKDGTHHFESKKMVNNLPLMKVISFP